MPRACRAGPLWATLSKLWATLGNSAPRPLLEQADQRPHEVAVVADVDPGDRLQRPAAVAGLAAVGQHVAGGRHVGDRESAVGPQPIGAVLGVAHSDPPVVALP